MRSGVRPACERHPGSRVQFFGRYGAPGRERQRFRCFPRDGAAHTFTEPTRSPSRCRAVVEVLGAIYETDFLGFSHGFRPGRSPHHALDALAFGITRKKVGWVLDADIRSFFTTLDHAWLKRFVEHRIADNRVLRLIEKWVSAGVIEDGAWTACEEGVPRRLRRRPAALLRPVSAEALRIG